MAIKDDIMQALEEDVIPLLHDEVWADSYVVVEATPTSDGEGGYTTVPTVIESGLCFRKSGNVQGGERVTADRLGYTSPVVVDLPATTLLKPSHTLRVNGYILEVGYVRYEGHGLFGVKAVATCQEVG